MRDEDKSKTQLIDELVECRNRRAALDASNQSLRILLDTVSDGALSLTTDLLVTEFNEAAGRLMGRETKEIIGQKLFDAFPEARGSIFEEKYLQGLKEKQPLAFETYFGIPPYENWYDVQVRPYQGGIWVVFQITTAHKQTEKESRDLQAQLRQSQKMESIGTLAGGVAHDVNNVLGSIMGLASLLEVDLTDGDPARDDVREIMAACKRGHDLTKNLLGFARKGKNRKEQFSLNGVIKKVKTLLRRTVARKIVIKTTLGTGLPHVLGDSGQISHALMNLGLNAVEAMGSAGVLLFASEAIELTDSDVAAFEGMKPGSYVQLRVSDTGGGMDAETLRQAFDPFFTTKPKGKGTGLGLSMVYGTIRNHGGKVTVESTVGEGTTVVVALPAAVQAHPLAVSAISESPPSSGSGTILLVEDEKILQAAYERMLKKLGYGVVVARNGREAVDRCREREGAFSLVIMDLILPVMDGAETFRALRKDYPKLKVLLSSGYAKEGKASELLAEGAVGFLQKPYSMEELAAEVFLATKT